MKTAEVQQHERDFMKYITSMKLLMNNISLNDIEDSAWIPMAALVSAENIVNSYKQMELVDKKQRK
jgi:hypothetical protein